MTDPRPPTRYKVGLVQMAMSAEAEANVQRAVAKVAQAAAAGAQLVCLPELFRSQYFAQREDPELFDLAEPVPGPSTEALGTAAKQAHVVVIAPVFERRAAGLYHNSAAVIDADGHVVGVYRKMRSEEHTSELQSRLHLVCRLLLEKKKNKNTAQLS